MGQGEKRPRRAPAAPAWGPSPVQIACVGLALVCAYFLLWPAEVSPASPVPVTVKPEVLAAPEIVVSESGVPGAGLGVFASRSFAQGELVGTYLCDVRLRDAKESDYSWALNATHECDGTQRTLGNPMRAVNSIAARSTCQGQNVAMRLRPLGTPGESPVTFVATRAIAVGEELFTDYGEEYFKRKAALRAAGIIYECGMGSLHLASQQGDLQEVRSLLAAPSGTASVDQAGPGALGWTPLMEAGAAGNVEMVMLLLQHRASLHTHAKDDGATPLFIAAQLGQVDAVKLMLIAGADKEAALDDGATSLWIAAKEGHTDCEGRCSPWARKWTLHGRTVPRPSLRPRCRGMRRRWNCCSVPSRTKRQGQRAAKRRSFSLHRTGRLRS